MTNVEQLYPLSPAQLGMLFHSLSAPESGVYVTQLALEIPGLNTEAMGLAFQRVVDRHPILRTAFAWQGVERPLQVVGRKVTLPVEELDWSHLAASERDEHLKDFLARDREKGFALDRAPLMRLAFVRLEANRYILVWSSHHILLDGWSVRLMFNEVLALYAGADRDDLPPVRPFSEFIEWLESDSDGKRSLEAERYFRGELAGFHEPTSLEAVYTGPEPLMAFESRQTSLSAEETRALESFARRQHLTLSTVARGLWAALLSLYSETDDVVFGVTVSGRPAELGGVESVLGLFINTLPVRVKLSRDARWTDFFARLQEQQAALQPYQHAPLVDVQSFSDLPQGTPLFESLLVFENYPAPVTGADEARAVSGARLLAFVDSANYPVSLVVKPGDALSLRLSYDVGRLDGEAAERVLSHFATLLRELLRDPEAAIRDASILEATERERLVAVNEVASKLPERLSLTELVAARVASGPDRVAIVDGDVVLTYRELGERARRLASRLRALGVGPESAVAVHMRRSAAMVVAFLAVLETRGFYVPLDPGHPPDRLARMLEHSRASVLLTEGALSGALGVGDRVVVDVSAEFETEADADAERRALAAMLAAAEDEPASGDDLAYCIYTSGSTGVPKGVAVSHRAVVRLVCSTNYVELGADDVVAQASNASFDAATFEIWGALVHGARLVIVPHDVILVPGDYERFLRDQRVTVLFVTTALFNRVANDQPRAFSSVGTVLFGGDAVDVGAVRRVLAAGGPERLLHVYGPTECTTFSTWHEVTSIEDGARTVPIGSPLAHGTAWVLDARGQPRPTGVTGELYLGGLGVARGYLHDPAETASRFVPDPFGPPGSRLYRTGDLVRQRGDGAVEFVGRRDHQLKIRGFRVELGEIEARLSRHPAVASNVVVARPNDLGEKALVAYVAMREACSVDELRDHLRAALPDYMIPTAFVTLDSLPVTPNGKVDRRALPPPGASSYLETTARKRPRTPIEESLVEIWSDVLAVQDVGVHDSFFDLGGHSLLATKLVSRVREAFRIELPLRSLFEHETVSGLALEVERRRGREAIEVDPFRDVDLASARDGVEPKLSFAQQRYWFLDRLDPETSAYNMPSAWRLTGRLDREALESSLSEILRRHEVLRTSYPSEGGKPSVRIGESRRVAVPVVDFSGLVPAARDAGLHAIAIREAEAPFDLERDPMLRARLVRLSENEHQLFVTFHHIAFDGWSRGVFLEELRALYASYQEGEAPSLPALPVQYRDFVSWQRRWVVEPAAESALSFWREKLGAGVPELDLPTDRPRPAVPTFRGGRLLFAFPAELTERLRELSRAEGATLFMTLLAGYVTLLSRYSHQEELVVGTPVAGRRFPELEPLIGCFVNMLALSVDVSGRPSFRELLARVRETCLEAFDHQDFPFERIVDVLEPERTSNRAPFYQATFALQNAGDESLELPGLGVVPVDLPIQTSRFDLELFVWDRPEGMGAVFYFSRDLFDDDTVTRMSRHYLRLLQDAAVSPGERIAELALLDSRERELFLETLPKRSRAGASPDPGEENVLERFAQQVRRGPERIAVTEEGAEGRRSSLSYAELDAASTRLASRLRDLGVGPEELVCLSLERSARLVTAVLGILKSGAAYVPLPTEIPEARLRFVLRDTRARLVVTENRHREKFAKLPVRLVCLDDTGETDAIASPTDAPPSRTPRADELAYVIYTSGSTGEPKGVMVSHGNVARLLSRTERWFGFGPGDVWTLFHSIAFDFSVWELFGSLAYGGRLVVVPQWVVRSPEAMYELLLSEEVTVLNQTPSAFRQLMRVDDELRSSELSLRYVIFGGEALELETLRDWYLRHGDSRPALVNMYGITETTVHVTYRPLRREDAELGGSPIGGSIDDLELYLLDRELAPVPQGVRGELAVGGAGLARGYLNRPALTAERFVPNPYGPPGSRLYLSGDEARYRSDRELEYVGRADGQVKVRGHRVELAEIEAVLRRHSGVEDAVVTLRRAGGEEDGRLVAYVVPDAARSAWLRRFMELDETSPAPLRRHELPSGRTFFCLNASETEFMEREIYAHGSYRRHGIRLRAGSTVFDVGANVGVFSLWAWEHGARVHAFEALSPLRDVLERNARLAGDRLRVYGYGLSNRRARERFTYYPHATVLSSRYGDERVERAVVKRYLENDNEGDLVRDSELVDELLEERLRFEEHECELRTLSDAIEESGVERIDLLKVDVEKAEEDVLEGLRAEDWSKVAQLVVEVHDIDGRLARMTGRLEALGFVVSVEEEAPLSGTGLFTLYGRRAETVAKEAYREPEEDDIESYGSETSLITALRRFSSEELPGYMIPSAWVVMPALPLNQNGKLDRKRLPEPEKGRNAVEAHFLPPRTEIEKELCEIWSAVLGVERVGVNDNFFELGGDSILSIQVVSRANERGLRLTTRQMFQHQTVAELSLAVGTSTKVRAEQGPVEGEVELSPMSRWFFEQELEDAHHFNQSVLLKTSERLDRGAMVAACRELVEHHDALRLSFHREEESGAWRGRIGGARDEAPVLWIDCREGAVDVARAVEGVADRVQRSLSLEGPLLRIVVFEEDSGGRVLIVLHHLAVDAVSWRILIEDLERGYEQAFEGEAIRLPAKTTSYRDWTAKLLARTRDERDVDSELAPWIAGAQLTLEPMPRDSFETSGKRERPDERLVRFARTHSLSLEPEITRVLLEATPLSSTGRLREALLAALVSTYARWTGEPRLWVDLESHGRDALGDEVDLSRTVGWFTAIYPVLLDVEGASDPRAALERVAERLASIPGDGAPFVMHRYLGRDDVASALARLPQPEVSFNYLGRYGSLPDGWGRWAVAPEKKGASRSERISRRHLHEVVAYVSAGRLYVDWIYSETAHRRATIEMLANGFLDALRALAAAWRDPAASFQAPESVVLLESDGIDLDGAISEVGLE